MSDRPWTTNPCEPLRGEMLRWLRERRVARQMERAGKAVTGRSPSTGRPRPLNDHTPHGAAPR